MPSDRANRTPATFAEADLELSTVLHSLDGAERYADWLVELFQPGLHGDVAEVGAGTGTMTERIAGRCRNVVAVEPSCAAFSHLQQRFADDASVRCLLGDHRSLEPGSVDAIVLSNVLEHIDDDDAALTDLRTALVPGGTLTVFSPAFEALYSDFDRRVGHFRRYRRERLADQLRAAGFDVIESRYVNALGGAAWFVYARILGRNPTGGRALALWDRFVIPVIRAVESRVTVPFGQSVLVIGRRVGD